MPESDWHALSCVRACVRDCQVDDGLELRKAAFEAMDTLLDRCPDHLDYAEFIAHLVRLR
jgi:TATA-binding protein interacting (TIP20)